MRQSQAARARADPVTPAEVHARLASHLLIDGLRLVLDAQFIDPVVIRAEGKQWTAPQ